MIYQIKESKSEYFNALKQNIFEKDDDGELATFFDIIYPKTGQISPEIKKRFAIFGIHNHFFVIQNQ